MFVPSFRYENTTDATSDATMENMTARTTAITANVAHIVNQQWNKV